MPTDRSALGTFADPSDAARAVRALRAAGFDVDAAMPAPFPELVDALARPRSRIDLITFPGALVGLLLGVLLTVGTSLAWPLVTGGKPIVSVPPFVIVIFEVTVLVGSLTNLVAVVLGGWSGRRRQAAVIRPRAVQDRIAVLARGGDPTVAAGILRESRAEEVEDG